MSDTQDNTDAKPTPGPWEALKSGSGFWEIMPPDGSNHAGSVVEVHADWDEHGNVKKEEARLNALLIAAAPLLKAQLYNLVQEAEDAAECLEEAEMGGPAGMLRVHIQDAKTALASAEGSGDE